MKTADELFEELHFKKKEGPNCDSKFKTVHCYELDNGNRKILRVSFFNNRQIWKCNFAEMTPKLTLAIFTKIKELGWDILPHDDWIPTYCLDIYIHYKESWRILECFGTFFEKDEFKNLNFFTEDDIDELRTQLTSILDDGNTDEDADEDEDQSMFDVEYCIKEVMQQIKTAAQPDYKITFPEEGNYSCIITSTYNNPDKIDKAPVTVDISISCPDRFD